MPFCYVSRAWELLTTYDGYRIAWSDFMHNSDICEASNQSLVTTVVYQCRLRLFCHITIYFETLFLSELFFCGLTPLKLNFHQVKHSPMPNFNLPGEHMLWPRLCDDEIMMMIDDNVLNIAFVYNTFIHWQQIAVCYCRKSVRIMLQRHFIRVAWS